MSGELGKICGGVLGQGELEVDDESPASFLIAQRPKLPTGMCDGTDSWHEWSSQTNISLEERMRERVSPFGKQKGRNHETWVSLRQQITKQPEKHDGCEVETVNKQDFLQVFQGSGIGKIEDNLRSADPLSYTTVCWRESDRRRYSHGP